MMGVSKRIIISSVLALMSAFSMMTADVCAQMTMSLERVVNSAEQNVNGLPAPSGFKYKPGAYSVDISWDAVEGAEGYRVYKYDAYWDEYSYCGYTYETNYKITGLNRNTTYKIKVCAFGGGENGPQSKAMNVKTLVVDTPILKSSYGIANGFSWDGIYEARYYKVYKYSSNTKKYEYIAKTEETSYIDKNAKCGKKYFYKVAAVCDEGTGRQSETYELTIPKLNTPKITAKYTTDGAYISWDRVEGAKSYNVYKYSDKTKDYVLIKKDISSWDNYYYDKKIKVGKTYYYKVCAVNDYGKSEKSQKYKLVVPKLKVPKVSGEFSAKSISLSWNSVDGARSYNVYKYNSKTKKFALIKKDISSWSNSYYDDNIKAGKTYYYKVCAVNDFGKSEQSKKISVKVPDMKLPSAPVIEKSEGTTYTVSFSWKPVKNAYLYNIYKYNSKTKKYELLTTTTSTSLTELALPNTTYYFKVSAKNLKGNGAKSKKIVITTKQKKPSSKWVCPACGTTNYDLLGIGGVCSYCKNLKPNENTWTCPRCGHTNLNFGFGVCSKCKNLKP